MVRTLNYARKLLMSTIANAMIKTLRYLVIFGSLCLLFACSEEESQYRLTSRERVRVDTLYSKEVKLIRGQLDSICEMNHDSLLKLAVDSILKVRIIEEAKLRARVPKDE